MRVPPNGWEEIKRYYGWSDADLADVKAWAARSLITVDAPAPMFYGADPVRRIYCHRAIADELLETFHEVIAAGLWRVIQNYSGCYVFRLKRNGTRLSMHSFGAAIDFDAPHNMMGTALERTTIGGTKEGREVVDIFEARGWTWGGRFPTPDAMHFQWAKGY